MLIVKNIKIKRKTYKYRENYNFLEGWLLQYTKIQSKFIA